jgi:hypothetical protein
MNPAIFVLCTAAVCLSMEERWDWVGPILLIAMVWALWQNWVNGELLKKIFKK